MRLIRIETLVDTGGIGECREFRAALHDIRVAIRAVVWPPGSHSFVLYDEPGRARGMGSGVKPIKDAFVARLRARGWHEERRMEVLQGARPGAIDAVKDTAVGAMAVEWETGNISSSHRALNKICVGLLNGTLAAGALVVPTRRMYYYLTDRVGNFRELRPYFPMWRSLPIVRGVLMIVAVEHDGVSKDVPKILKGTDGRALQ